MGRGACEGLGGRAPACTITLVEADPHLASPFQGEAWWGSLSQRFQLCAYFSTAAGTTALHQKELAAFLDAAFEK